MHFLQLHLTNNCEIWINMHQVESILPTEEGGSLIVTSIGNNFVKESIATILTMIPEIQV
jgi:hypothetical protein